MINSTDQTSKPKTYDLKNQSSENGKAWCQFSFSTQNFNNLFGILEEKLNRKTLSNLLLIYCPNRFRGKLQYQWPEMHIKNLLLPQQARISLKAPHFQSQTPPSEFQFFLCTQYNFNESHGRKIMEVRKTSQWRENIFHITISPYLFPQMHCGVQIGPLSL